VVSTVPVDGYIQPLVVVSPHQENRHEDSKREQHQDADLQGFIDPAHAHEYARI
jgi:hypothetical protein